MPEKNPAAVALGRRGGLATAARLTDAEREARARRAADARWAEERERKLARRAPDAVVRKLMQAIERRPQPFTLFSTDGQVWFERTGSRREQRWRAIHGEAAVVGTYGPGATADAVMDDLDVPRRTMQSGQHPL